LKWIEAIVAAARLPKGPGNQLVPRYIYNATNANRRNSS